MMDIVMQTYGHKAPEVDVLRAWWMKLERFDFDNVRKAFDKWIETQKHRPTIADIIELCKPKDEFYMKLEKKIDKEYGRQRAAELKDYLKSLQKNSA